MRMLLAGQLNESVTVQSKTVTRDAYGAEAITWTTVATMPAAAEPISGREYLAMRAAQADISIRFRLRYRAGISPAMRVRWRNNNYDIVEVINPRAADRELQLLCRGEAAGA